MNQVDQSTNLTSNLRTERRVRPVINSLVNARVNTVLACFRSRIHRAHGGLHIQGQVARGFLQSYIRYRSRGSRKPLTRLSGTVRGRGHAQPSSNRLSTSAREALTNEIHSFRATCQKLGLLPSGASKTGVSNVVSTETTYQLGGYRNLFRSPPTLHLRANRIAADSKSVAWLRHPGRVSTDVGVGGEVGSRHRRNRRLRRLISSFIAAFKSSSRSFCLGISSQHPGRQMIWGKGRNSPGGSSKGLSRSASET